MAPTPRSKGPRPSAGGDVILLDASGHEFNATAMLSAWRSGGNESRMTRSWAVTDASINALLAGDVVEVRRRSRDIVRKNAWAQSGSDSFVGNAVGNGIVPRPLTEDDELRREIMEAWDEFVLTCDADGVCDFYGLQALIERARREGGECFVRLRDRRPGDGLAIPLQLQTIEPEQVDPAYEESRTNGARTRAGIEFDAVGRRVAYWMWRDHPGDTVSLRNSERVRVPAENVIHVYKVLRPGQIRGVPDNAPILDKLWELSKYDVAELVRKQIASMFAGFVTKLDPNADPLGAGATAQTDHEGKPMARLEPGTMQELPPGTDVRFTQPPSDGAGTASFVQHQLRQVAAALNVTYEQLTGDLTGVNYSSIRAGLIEFWRRMGQHQRNVLIFQLCRPVWRRFVEAAVLSGRIPAPRTPAELRDLFRVAWTPTPGREYVDPEKEVRAIIARLRAGLLSRSKAVAENGFDAEAVEREIETDNERADRRGLRFSSDGRFPETGATAGPSGSPFGREREAFPPETDDEGDPEMPEPRSRAQAIAMMCHLAQIAASLPPRAAA